MPLMLASDNFNRSNENPLSGGGNWLTSTGETPLQITSDFVSCTTLGGNTNYQYYNGGISWPNDQYSQVQLTTNVANSGTSSGCMVRISATTATFYTASIINGNLVLSKVVAGSFTSLATVSYSFTNGDVMLFQVVGTTLSCYMNGVLKTTTTDSSITSGFPGIFMQTNTGTTGNVNSDNWSGGSPDLSAYPTQAGAFFVGL